jgi:hypothetical protein
MKTEVLFAATHFFIQWMNICPTKLYYQPVVYYYVYSY